MGVLAGVSLGLEKLEVFLSGRFKTPIRDEGPGQGSLCVMEVGPGVIEDPLEGLALRWGRGWSVWDLL